MDNMTLAGIILFGGGGIAALIAYWLIKRSEEKESQS